jgi:uncharacterized SAM-binding protein YcdF (DUF218 family)
VITLAMLFCLVGSAGFALFRRRKTAAIAISLTLIAFEAVGSGWIPSLLLSSLQLAAFEETPDWGERNVIIVLGDGTVRLPAQSIVRASALAYSRILEAVRLYGLAKKSNHQCNILISGGDASGTGMTEADVYRAEMVQLGVTDSDILLERRSMNTFQNAEFTESILHGQQIDKLFLVTSGLHLPRALLYFGYFNIHPTPCGADYVVPPISIQPTGYNFAIADLAAHEYLGIVRYYIYNLLGWNPKVTR